MASSLLVIKVKFGETLRRLTASVEGNALSLNIVMLKEKIRRLLSFGSNVMFTMTYADEDGDMVILATEDDLRDILRQSLNPLRITVNLSNGTPVGSSVGTTSSAPMTLTPFQLQLQQKQKQLQQQFQQLQLQRLLQQQQHQLQQQHLQQQTLQQQNSRQNGQRFRQNSQLQQQHFQQQQQLHYIQAIDSQVSGKLNIESGSSDSESLDGSLNSY